ncbi:zinc finger protein 608-like protein, partial [Dinothrombium tinctorium]
GVRADHWTKVDNRGEDDCLKKRGAINAFDEDNNEWELGISELIIDLDADIEKDNDMSSGKMANPKATKAGNYSSTASKSGLSSGGHHNHHHHHHHHHQHANANKCAATVEHQATVERGLKMKIKRKSIGGKSSGAKHEIVQSNSRSSSSGAILSHISSQQLVSSLKASSLTTTNKKNGNSNLGQSSHNINSAGTSSSETKLSKYTSNRSRSGSHRERREKIRDRNPSTNVSLSVSKAVLGSSEESSEAVIASSGAILTSNPKVTNIIKSNSRFTVSSANPIKQAKFENCIPIAVNENLSGVHKEKLPNCDSDLNFTNTEDFSKIPSQKKSTVDKSDDCMSPFSSMDTWETTTSTSTVGTLTEPDCLGPCEPGTSVSLEGIVWQETERGVLVVNITWRGKTYVGTLLDCTQSDWAPPRFYEYQTIDSEAKTIKGNRGKRNKMPAAEYKSELRNIAIKLRNNKGRRTTNSGFTIPLSPVKSESGLILGKRKGKLLDCDPSVRSDKNGKRGRSQSKSISHSEPSTPQPQPSSPILIECPEPNCNKKYKHINGLKYHQAHAHSVNNDVTKDEMDGDVTMDETFDGDSKEAECEEMENKTNIELKAILKPTENPLLNDNRDITNEIDAETMTTKESTTVNEISAISSNEETKFPLSSNSQLENGIEKRVLLKKDSLSSLSTKDMVDNSKVEKLKEGSIKENNTLIPISQKSPHNIQSDSIIESSKDICLDEAITNLETKREISKPEKFEEKREKQCLDSNLNEEIKTSLGKSLMTDFTSKADETVETKEDSKIEYKTGIVFSNLSAAEKNQRSSIDSFVMNEGNNETSLGHITNLENVQSPAYSDISEAYDSYSEIENTNIDKNGERKKQIQSRNYPHPQTMLSGSGEYRYFNEPSINQVLMSVSDISDQQTSNKCEISGSGKSETGSPRILNADFREGSNVSLGGEPSNDREHKELLDQKPHIIAKEFTTTLSQPFHNPYTFIQGYPFSIDPSSHLRMLANDSHYKKHNDKYKERHLLSKEQNSSEKEKDSHSDNVIEKKRMKSNFLSLKIGKSDEERTNRSDVLKQNENRQILKENIELKSQMNAQSTKILHNSDAGSEEALLRSFKNSSVDSARSDKAKNEIRKYNPFEINSNTSRNLSTVPSLSKIDVSKPNKSMDNSRSKAFSSVSSIIPKHFSLTSCTSALSSSLSYPNSHKSSPKLRENEICADRKDLEAKRENKSKTRDEGEKATTEIAGPSLSLPKSYFSHSPYIHASTRSFAPLLPFDSRRCLFGNNGNPTLINPYEAPPPPTIVHSQFHFQPESSSSPIELSTRRAKPIANECLVSKTTSVKHMDMYSSHKIHELQERAISPDISMAENKRETRITSEKRGSSSPIAASSKSPISDAFLNSSSSEKNNVHSPPPQRHLHTHHHTHVGVGYPIYDPYGGKSPSYSIKSLFLFSFQR